MGLSLVKFLVNMFQINPWFEATRHGQIFPFAFIVQADLQVPISPCDHSTILNIRTGTCYWKKIYCKSFFRSGIFQILAFVFLKAFELKNHRNTKSMLLRSKTYLIWNSLNRYLVVPNSLKFSTSSQIYVKVPPSHSWAQIIPCLVALEL